MKRHELFPNISVFLGRSSQCGAGGHSTTGTGPESPVLRGAPAGGGAGLRPAGADGGEGRG
jgi:hypothetical protein